MKTFRWQIALMAFMLTLWLAIGAVYLRQRQMINEPLLKRISELENVKEVELQQEDGIQVVVVHLDYVHRLAHSYNEIHTEVSQLLNKENYRLELVDERDQLLEEAYLAVHLLLYEGEQRGNFAQIGSRLPEILASYKVDEHLLSVDGKNIYLQMKKGNAYLFEIIVRENRGREGEHV